MMKTLLFLLVGGIVSCRGTAAQQAPLPAARYAATVVELRGDGTGEEGSGFVVGSTPDSVYIVTAGHVLGSASATLRARLYGSSRTLPVRVRFFAFDGTTDLALLAVAARQHHWEPWPVAHALTPGDSLCFVRPVLLQEPGVGDCYDRLQLPLDGYGEMLLTNRQLHTIDFALAGVEPGDSGSALLVGTGEVRIVGMIIKRAPHKAISISYIKQILQPILGDKWQLPD